MIAGADEEPQRHKGPGWLLDRSRDLDGYFMVCDTVALVELGGANAP